MTCNTCKIEYGATRSSSMYCSPKCRKLAFQKVSVPEKTENANGATQCSHSGECLDRKDWKEIFEEGLSANQYHKMCSVNYFVPKREEQPSFQKQ